MTRSHLTSSARTCTPRSRAARWSGCGPPAIARTCPLPPRPWRPSPASLTSFPVPAFRASVSHDLASEAFYAALADDDPAELYDNAPCGYLSTLPDGTIINANATFLAWTGYDRAAPAARGRFQDPLVAGAPTF